MAPFNYGRFTAVQVDPALNLLNPNHRFFEADGAIREDVRIGDPYNGLQDVDISFLNTQVTIGVPVYVDLDGASSVPSGCDAMISMIITAPNMWNKVQGGFGRVQTLRNQLMQNAGFDLASEPYAAAVTGYNGFVADVINKDLATVTFDPAQLPLVEPTWFDDKCASALQHLARMQREIAFLRHEIRRLRQAGQLTVIPPPYNGMDCDMELYYLSTINLVAVAGYANDVYI